jgi:hypothetical protein
MNDIKEIRTYAKGSVNEMLHLGAFDTYTIDDNGNYVVTRQTGYIKGDSNNLKAIEKSNGGLFQVVLDLSTYPAISYSSISDIESNYPKKTAVDAWASSSGSIAYFPGYNRLEMYATGCDTADNALAYFLANPIFVQYKLSASYTETYDPLHFARIQPYALEYAKSEADRSSNLIGPILKNASAAGLTFVNNGDGSYRVYGTATLAQVSNESSGYSDVVLKPGKYYWSTGNSSVKMYSVGTGYNQYIDLTSETAVKFYLQWDGTPGSSVDIIFYPMLNEGSHPLPYQPYEGPVAHLGSTQTWTAAQNLGTGTTINGATIVTSLTISYDSSTQTLTLF